MPSLSIYALEDGHQGEAYGFGVDGYRYVVQVISRSPFWLAGWEMVCS